MRKRAALAALLALTVAGAAANGTQGADTKAPSAGPGAGTASEGRKLFTGGTTPSCATCHALRDAGATGNVGPDLDELKPDAGRVRNAVQKGFENMPAFGHALSDRQIDAISRYVEQAAGK